MSILRKTAFQIRLNGFIVWKRKKCSVLAWIFLFQHTHTHTHTHTHARARARARTHTALYISSTITKLWNMLVICKINLKQLWSWSKELGTCSQRYQFYIGILVHKCLNGMASAYLSDPLTFIRDLHEHNTRNEHFLLIPPCHTNAMKRSFAYSAASLWNKLPLSCYDDESFNYFKRVLHSSIINTSWL